MIRIPIRFRPQIRPRIQILPLILILFLFPSLSGAARRRVSLKPPKSPALQTIHRKFKEYDSQREELQKTSLPSASGTSSEGTKAEAFRKSGKLVIVDETYFAESGQTAWSYYFDGHRPFFVLEAATRYAFPITVSETERKKLGGGEDKKTENRYYFTKGRLIRWLEGRKSVPLKSPRFREQAKTILEHAGSAYRNALEAKSD